MLKKIKQHFSKKSVTYGQTLPSWQTNQPVWNDWTTERAIQYGYKSSTYVFSCINLISRSAASVPWKVYQKDAKGNRIEKPGHPLQMLIENPNPFMTRKDFIEKMTQNLYLGGNAIFSKVRANGTVVELWGLPADSVKPVPDANTFIKHYVFEKDGKRLEIETKDIIHNLFTNPADPYWGISPLQAGAKIIDTDVEAVRFNKVSLQNRALTDGVFSFKQALTREQWEQAREMIRDQHQGSANARQPWVLGGEASWTPMTMTPAEMDFIESRRFTRTEICSLFQVPPPMIGLYEDATLANIETARKIFWLDTMIPYLTDIQNCLNLSLAKEFGKDIELCFDVSNVQALQTSMTEKITSAKELWSMGVPFNVINQKLEMGFDDIPGGDQGFVPTGVIPSDIDFSEAPDNQEAQKSRKFEIKTGFLSGLNLKNEAHISFYWKNLERRRNKWDRALTRKTEELFEKEAEKVLEAFKDKGLTAALSVIEDNQKVWNEWLLNSWKGMTSEFGRDAYEDILQALGAKAGNDFFNPWDQLIRNYITSTVGDKIKLIQQFSKQQVKDVVFKIREEGGTMDQIARAIKAKYDDFKRYRTYRIARTEVVGASNFANMQSARQASENHDITLVKKWVSSRDDRVRDSHEEVDGETRDREEKFSNGLLFPADYSADLPAETIQCRCALSWEVDDKA